MKLATTIAVLLLLVFTASAQTGTEGSILGTIVDSTGAAIPEAAVTVTNIETGIAYKTISDSGGYFQVLALPRGPYSVTVQKTGFATWQLQRVELTAQLAHSVDTADAVARLKNGLARIPNVLPKPAVVVEILSFNERGPVLAVRPYCSNEHYWQVYFDANRVIRETFSAAGYPVPEAHQVLRTMAEKGMPRAA